jgi:ATP-dependent DNA ligase
MREFILDNTPKGNFTVYNAEVIHQKTRTIKDVLYVFDVLVWDGYNLIGNTYGQRYSIFEKFISQTLEPDRTPIPGSVMRARNIPANRWNDSWESVQDIDWIEGLVLKRTGGVSVLRYGTSEVNNDGFMLRVRKPSKNSPT